jgi:hypothetical protein
MVDSADVVVGHAVCSAGVATVEHNKNEQAFASQVVQEFPKLEIFEMSGPFEHKDFVQIVTG